MNERLSDLFNSEKYRYKLQNLSRISHDLSQPDVDSHDYFYTYVLSLMFVMDEVRELCYQAFDDKLHDCYVMNKEQALLDSFLEE